MTNSFYLYRLYDEFRELLSFTRYFEWHPSKIPFILGLLFMLGPDIATTTEVFRWYVVVTLFLAFAYMLNNVGDLSIDEKTGKMYQLRHWSSKAKFGATLVLGIIGFLFSLYTLDLFTIISLGGCYVLAWSYSFPPRFKENIWLGPIVASVGQLCAPTIMILIASRIISGEVILYILIMFLYGLRMIFVHQIFDRDNDAVTGVKTTVLHIGLENSRKLLKKLFAFELASVLFLMFQLYLLRLPVFVLLISMIPSVHYAIRVFYSLRISLEDYEYIPLADFYEMVLPFMLAVSLFVQSEGKAWWAPVIIILIAGRRNWNRLSSTFYGIKELKRY